MTIVIPTMASVYKQDENEQNKKKKTLMLYIAPAYKKTDRQLVAEDQH